MSLSRSRAGVVLPLVVALLYVPAAAAELPESTIQIGTQPQFVFDNHLVDNVWALKYKRESVRRVFHQPKKHEANPVIAGTGGFLSVARDKKSGRWQMWFQTSVVDPQGDEPADYAVAYAESTDGLKWTLPNLGLFAWQGSKDNSIVWTGIKGRRASSPFLVDVPENDSRGHRFVFLYRETDGMHLVGSQDGIHWDKSSDRRISPIHSDTQNAIVYDSARGQYVLFCRAKHAYRTFRGDILDTGESRRAARMASKELWTDWTAEPHNILLPDELDAREGFDSFYGMPITIYGGVWWGFLWPFKTNTDIHTELAYSRDGERFERLPDRPKLIERGPQGAWDDGMVFGGYQWIEVGDEWWMYYAGWDGPHETRDRKPGIGLVRLRREGFISMRGPPGGGVIVTRPLLWPGGKLLVNADASGGELKVRVSDGRRKVLPGFDYADCQPIQADGVRCEVAWKNGSIDSLAGQTVRLEFFLRAADLYTFRATGPEAP
jgi:hypothetical protein